MTTRSIQLRTEILALIIVLQKIYLSFCCIEFSEFKVVVFFHDRDMKDGFNYADLFAGVCTPCPDHKMENAVFVCFI